MKRNDIPLYLSILSAGLVLMFSSCEKYLSIDPPNDKLATATVFADSASAALAITGIYSSMMGTNSGFVAYQVRLAGLCADELAVSANSANYQQFYQNSLTADNNLLAPVWTSLYTYIYQANSAAEGVAASPFISASAKQVLEGEAKFIRAFLFLYAAADWGDVPLTLTTDYRINSIMPRIPAGEVYSQIIRDLKDAELLLPADYPTTERVRPNKMAARALLARACLYAGDWQQAERYSSMVISSGQYLPLPAPGDVFLKGSRETIWQLFPATLGGSYDTYDGAAFVPTSMTNSTVPFYLIPDDLYTSFEAADSRRAAWIGTKSVGGIYRFPNKYKVRSRTSAQESREYTVVLRLAEQYLIRAEARAQLGNFPEAAGDLNTVRSRAGLGSLRGTLSGPEVLKAVENERRHEFFCEWGHRWADLRRTARIDEVMSAAKGANWQRADMLWPVPLDQIQANPFLVQNESY